MFALFLVTSNVAEVHAEAGLLTVLGGSIATGGLTGEALVSAVAPYMAPVLLGIMVAGGLNVYLTEQSQAAGMTKTEYLTSKVREYCDTAGKPIDKFWGDFAAGCEVLENGSIAIGEQARTQVKQFINYLQRNNEIIDNSNTGQVENIDISGYTFQKLTSGVNYDILINQRGENVGFIFNVTSAEGPLAWTYYNRTGTTSRSVLILSKYPFSGKINSTGGSSGGRTDNARLVNGYYYFQDPVTATETQALVDKTYYDGTFLNFISSLDGSFEETSSSPTYDGITGTNDDIDNTNSALSPSAGATPVLNPGLVDGIDLEGLAGVTTTVQEYLDALRDVLDGVRDPAITGEREDTGEKDTIAIDEDDVADPAIDPVLDPDLPPVKTPVVDPNSEPTGENAVKPLTMDLKTVFPFCLPFDAYKMLQKLNASPVAPSYTVNWYIPIVNQYLNFTVDLSGFDSVAAVLRNMELIAFCVGLAIVTRNIIRS